MIEKSVEDFLKELSSSSATPGGGSAAALMGSMGAALVSMVANLTTGKKKYESVEKEVLSILEQSDELRKQLLEAINKDVEAFDTVMAAYGLPKDTDEQKLKRSSKIQDALKAAIDAPMECAFLATKVMPLCRKIAEIGNVNINVQFSTFKSSSCSQNSNSCIGYYIDVTSFCDLFAQRHNFCC